MAKVCVTGGAGFIGTYVVRNLLSRGHSVTVLDDLSVGPRRNVPVECRFVENTILNEDAVKDALSDSEVLVHLAARVAIRSSMEKIYDDSLVNYTGTAQLLTALQDNKSTVQRVVFASSMAVYGDVTDGRTLDEFTSPTVPISPYGVSKLASERSIQLVCDNIGINHTVLRLFNTFGKGQTYSPYVGVMTIFATKLLNEESLSVFGDGNQVRDYVYVEDVSDAIVAAVEVEDSQNHVLNVGTGRGTNIWQLIRYYEEAIGRPAKTVTFPAIPGEMRNSIANPDRLRNQLNVNPGLHIASSIPEILEEIEARRVS